MRTRWFHGFTIFPKLVLTFLIVILPLIAITFAMNITSERLVRKQLTSSMQAQVNYYMNALESDFNHLISLQQQYLNDDDIVKLSSYSRIMSDLVYTETIKNIQNRLLLMKNTSPYALESFVHIPSMDRKISAAGFETIAAEEALALNQLTNPYENPFIVYENHLWISIPYPILSSLGQKFTLGLEISNDALMQSLSNFSLNGSEGAMLISENFSWNISEGNIPAPLAHIKQTLYEQSSADASSGYAVLRENRNNFYMFYDRSARLGLTLAIFVDENQVVGPIKQYEGWLWWLAVASVLVVLIFSYRIYRLIHSPLSQLVRAFHKLETGNLSIQLKYPTKDEFNYLYIQFNKMVHKLRELIDEVYVQKYHLKVAELKQLQSQINPHFLYNSFFNLYTIAKMHEIDKVIHFVKHLGDYFKYVTKSADLVTLGKEVVFCRSYVAIQSIRFEDHIKVDFDEVPVGLLGLLVPKLFLQPLIENCYLHGLEERQAQGLIRIVITDCGNGAKISVEDNGNELSDEQLDRIVDMFARGERISDSEGLLNVQKRLILHYGDESGMTAERGPMGGLKLTIMIPKKGETAHVPSLDRGQ